MLCSDSSDLHGPRREGGEDSRPRVFNWFTLETSVPENSACMRDEGSDFSRQPQIKLPWSKTDAGPLRYQQLACSPPLLLSGNWAYKALSFSTPRDPRTAVTPWPACGQSVTVGARSHPKGAATLQFCIFEVNMAMHGVTPMHQLPCFAPSSVLVRGGAGSAPAAGTAAPLQWLQLSCAWCENPEKHRLKILNSSSPLPYPLCLWPCQPRLARL